MASFMAIIYFLKMMAVINIYSNSNGADPFNLTTKLITASDIQFRFTAENENGESTKYYYPVVKARVSVKTYNTFSYLVS